MSCLQSCICLWSVCGVVVVPYVGTVVVVTVMCVLLFVLHVCVLRWCERGTAMLVGGLMKCGCGE